MSTDIRLVLCDVDGTLVTSEKTLSDATVDAVRRLGAAGISFAVTSGRPPRGLSMLVTPLALSTPLAAFNGGLIVDTSLNTLRQLTIDDTLVKPLIARLASLKLSIWVYQGTKWFVTDLEGPHVARESAAVGFSPEELPNFDAVSADVVKIVGVSDDPELVQRAQRELETDYASRVSPTCSQTYYLDVTNPNANKGAVVSYLAQHLGIEPRHVATIGDMSNDLLMFKLAGVSVAMGNASDEVQQHATYVTATNDDDGVARAINDFILNQAP